MLYYFGQSFLFGCMVLVLTDVCCCNMLTFVWANGFYIDEWLRLVISFLIQSIGITVAAKSIVICISFMVRPKALNSSPP